MPLQDDTVSDETRRYPKCCAEGTTFKTSQMEGAVSEKHTPNSTESDEVLYGANEKARCDRA